MRNGQSIVEVLIGIAVGAILIVGATAVIAPALQSNKQASKVEAGAAFGKELADNVRSWSEGDWHNILSIATGSANTYYLNTSVSPFVAVSVPSIPGFSLNQTGANGSNASGISTSCTFAHRPSQGDLEIVAFDQDAMSAPTATVQDANGNVFTVTPTSPTSTYDTTLTGTSYLAYLLNAPANASQTITATFGLGSPAGIEIECDDFAVNGGGASFDQAAAGSGIGTAVNTPSVAVTGGNTDLLYAEYSMQHSAVSANAPWTLGGGGINPFFGGTAEYILSTTSATAASFTANPSGDWNSQGASFKFTSSGFTGQSLMINGVAYSRYFYVSDVYRDTSGNVTSTIGNCVASATCYDPSTKQVTVVYGWSGGATSSITEYVTRDRTALFIQSDWSGGAGATSPVTTVANAFASSTGITYSIPGAITVTPTALSSSYSFVRSITIDHTKVSGTGPPPAFVQSAYESTNFNDTATTSFANNVTAGDVIAVALNANPGVSVTSVTATCVTGDLIIVANDTSVVTMALAYGVVSTSGACTVTGNFSGTAFEIVAQEISGVDLSDPLDGTPNTMSQGGTTLAVSNALTTASSGDYIFGAAFAGSGGTTYTATSTFLLRANATFLATEDAVQTSPGSVTAEFVPNQSASHRVGIMAFRPAVSLYNFPVLLSGTYSYLKTAAHGGNLTSDNGYDVGFAAVPQLGYVQSQNLDIDTNNTAVTSSFVGSVTAGDVIAVAVAAANNISLSSVTDHCGVGGASDAYTIVASTSFQDVALAYGVVGASGSGCTVTATMSNNVGFDDFEMITREISGVDTSDPLDGFAVNDQIFVDGTPDAITSGNITTTNDGDYIFGATINRNDEGVTIAAGTGYSPRELNYASSWLEMTGEDTIQSSAGSIAATFTAATGCGGDGCPFSTGIMAFKPLAQTETNATVPLDYEQQTYSSSTGVVDYWVKVPNVSSATDTIIYMFYDNSTITTDQSNSRDVWRDGYGGVWHLENGTTLNPDDSSPFGGTGTLYNGPTATTGKIGGAGSFNTASTQAIYIGTNDNFRPTNVVTISAWFNISGAPIAAPIVDNWENGGYGLQIDTAANGACPGSTTGQLCGAIHIGGSYNETPVSSVSTSTWHYGVVTYDGRNLTLYTDGASSGSTSVTGTIDEPITNEPICIGGNPYLNVCDDSAGFNGSIDEVRMSTIARSADWIATEYNDQNSPSTFYNVGAAGAP